MAVDHAVTGKTRKARANATNPDDIEFDSSS
jgi:hypothetical protein